MSVRVPQHLHKPIQILFWDAHEFVVLVLAFSLSLFLERLFCWILFFGAAFVIIKLKRKNPRGWIMHLPYRVGLMRLKGYPLPTATKFSE